MCSWTHGSSHDPGLVVLHMFLDLQTVIYPVLYYLYYLTLIIMLLIPPLWFFLRFLLTQSRGQRSEEVVSAQTVKALRKLCCPSSFTQWRNWFIPWLLLWDRSPEAARPLLWPCSSSTSWFCDNGRTKRGGPDRLLCVNRMTLMETRRRHEGENNQQRPTENILELFLRPQLIGPTSFCPHPLCLLCLWSVFITLMFEPQTFVPQRQNHSLLIKTKKWINNYWENLRREKMNLWRKCPEDRCPPQPHFLPLSKKCSSTFLDHQ